MEQQRGSDFPQDKSSLQGSSDTGWKRFYKVITKFYPLKYLLQRLQRAWSCFWKLFPKVAISSRKSPERPVWRARKCVGMAARILSPFIPSPLQQALGFLNYTCVSVVSEEILKLSVKPPGKGNKRKQDDLVLEKDQCWTEALLEDLPEDEGEEEDPTYEPTKLETDSEEYKSQNDTEMDVEYEENDGFLMLKEDPILPDQTAEGSVTETLQSDTCQLLEHQIAQAVTKIIRGIEVPDSGNSQDHVVGACGAE